MTIDCKNIPVRVIALSDEKFARAKKEIEKAVKFSSVKHWQAVRGKDLFDKSMTLLPNFHDIVENKYPHLKLPRQVPLLSTQAIMSLQSESRTTLSDLNNAGAVGCALSHISVWQNIVQNEIPAIIVFEDDVVFKERFISGDSDFRLELNKILQQFPLDFDVLNLNLVTIPAPFVHQTKLIPTDFENVVKLDGIALRAQGYLITLAGAKKLLQNIFPLLQIVDFYMSMQTVLQPSRNDFTFLATKEPWLNHPLVDLSANSDIGYGLIECCGDSMFFIPRIVSFIIVILFLLSFIVTMVFLIFRITKVDASTSEASEMEKNWNEQ